MLTSIDVRELPSRLDEALKLTDAGGEVVITDGSKPRARLLPADQGNGNRLPGLHRGAMTMADDFDAPLPDEFWLGQS